ncbi:MAG: proline--tRNA ligase [Deltaproteobacteria bacterium]|nr:proline--tRNA ligase [Deltaproteobacteria bacterium]
MRFTKMLIPTIKEAPKDAEVISHQLMLRAGMIRKVASGIYNFLPLGIRVIKKVEDIVREEMNRAGALEVLMPMVVPSELWQESKRWDVYGRELLRFKDRHDRAFCLGPTHEEVITDIVRRDVRSYRQMPLNLYQIQTKFRDEIRPRFGLMRGREFIMKDAYSFHATDEDAEREYKNMHETYSRIFERCGLKFKAVEADTGQIGGSFSHEFMVLADTGEDAIASCNKCRYAANVEKAEAKGQESGVRSQESKKPLEKVATPNMKSVEEVSRFLNVSPQAIIKTLIYDSSQGGFAVMLRGDYEINEAKLKRVVNADWVKLADDKTVRDVTNAPSGFAGPIGLKCRLIADYSIQGIVNAVTGANEKDAHLINVNLDRDFKVDIFADLRNVVSGDNCPRCDGTLEIMRGIEVGHIFKLGTKYSEAMNATFLDENGKEKPFIMGCYGIGIGRTAAAAIEQNHDKDGIIWPVPIVPFHAYIIPVNVKDKVIMDVAEDIYNDLQEADFEVLMDDRDERAGVKFKDADLIGIPVRITIGSKNLENNMVEIKLRKETGSFLVDKTEVVNKIKVVLG